MVSRQFLDHAYMVLHDAQTKLGKLQKIDCFEDNGYSDKVHRAELKAAKERAKEIDLMIHEYIEAHSAS